MAAQELGRIDIWVNNAGIGAIGAFERIPLEVHEQIIGTDLLGTIYGSHDTIAKKIDAEVTPLLRSRASSP